MLEILRKSWAFVSLLLIFALLASLVFCPALAQPMGAAVLVVSLGVTVLFTIQNHWQRRQAGGGKQFARNLALDLLGLGLTIGAAMYAGQLAGAYFGLRAGLWAGLLAGLAAGFLAAWVARFAWERLAAKA
jgi:predicted MFS family arabinose efflux permease